MRARHRGWRVRAACVIVAVLLVPGIATASPGELDPTFSGNGWVRTLEVTTPSNNYLPDGAHGAAVGPGGKIFTAGELIDGESHWYFGAFSYLLNGDLDPSFGEGGWVDDNLGSFELPWAVEVQRDGKILVGGESDCTYAMCLTLARYLPGGGLDSTFGGDGIVQTKFGRHATFAYDIDLAPGGKIVAVGRRFKYGDALDDQLFAVVRYGSNGKLDKSFSDNGKVSIDFGFGDDIAESVVALPNGKVVVAGSGTRNLYTTDDDFAIARLRPDGSLDRSFSGDGKKTIDFGAGRGETGFDVARHRSGYVVVGSTSAGDRPTPKMAVARVSEGGATDRGFGLRRLSPGGHGGYATSVVVDGADRILVGGRAFEDSDHDSSDWIVSRILPGGATDSSWSGGFARVDFGTGEDQVNDLVLQRGKPVAAGSIYGSLGVARFEP